jgi:hypothetical protein
MLAENRKIILSPTADTAALEWFAPVLHIVGVSGSIVGAEVCYPQN